MLSQTVRVKFSAAHCTRNPVVARITLLLRQFISGCASKRCSARDSSSWQLGCFFRFLTAFKMLCHVAPPNLCIAVPTCGGEILLLLFTLPSVDVNGPFEEIATTQVALDWPRHCLLRSHENPTIQKAKDLVVRVRTPTVSTFKSVRTGVGTARITHAPPALAHPLNTIDIVHNNQRNSGDGRKKEVLDHAADTSVAG
eukprot:m.103651 g.103651  ORF g.103651 m.103651 type:complete len:198 (+) comp12582_c0_seq3:1165-1758(+)